MLHLVGLGDLVGGEEMEDVEEQSNEQEEDVSQSEAGVTKEHATQQAPPVEAGEFTQESEDDDQVAEDDEADDERFGRKGEKDFQDEEARNGEKQVVESV